MSIPILTPASTALLVMDLQHSVLAGLSEADRLLDRVNAAVEAAGKQGIPVVRVFLAFDDDDLGRLPTTGAFAGRLATAGRALHVDAPATQPHERAATRPGDLVVRKTRIGAFTTSDLGALLSERGITTVVLAGAITSGVVLSTAREATDRDLDVVVLSDATVDRDPEVHEFLLRRVLPTTSTVMTVDEFAAAAADPIAAQS